MKFEYQGSLTFDVARTKMKLGLFKKSIFLPELEFGDELRRLPRIKAERF